MTTSNSESPPSGIWDRSVLIYQLADKSNDFIWAKYFTRPYAALILSVLHKVPWTPNFLSVVSTVIGLAGIAVFAFWPGYVGLWVGWGLGQLSYTVDCMDGMLARYKKLYSRCGVSMDFLGDAIKQIFLFGAIGYRLWAENSYGLGVSEAWPLYGALIGTPFVATSLAMTTFLRSPEVTGKQARELRTQHKRTLVGLVMRGIAFLMNYPSWILIPVIFNRIDIFLAISIPLYILYSGYALLLILKKVCGHRHYEMEQEHAQSIASSNSNPHA